jgi:hypothetical protein
MQQPRAIYMASMDVVKSFDSIKHDKLMSVVEGLLPHDAYCIRRCSGRRV